MQGGDPTTLSPGSLIAGKYRVISKLGEGGMGVVYEAVHQRLRQRVAIKMLLASLAEHDELVERFEREARAAATIESPNVAKVIDVDFTLDGVPYMVIEFLEGHDLATELETKVQLSIAEAVGHVMTACAPIAQAHALGIVHRDLKPSNLFLAKKGEDYVLKVLDFGIAKVLSEQNANAKITSSMFGLGTPHYMSPEQIRRSSNVDGRSDIWSLGVILYELLTGTVPFPPEPTAAIAAISADPIVPPRELRREIPEGLDRAIMRALEKDREKRFPTAREFAVALAPFAPEEELVTFSLSEAMPRHSANDWSDFVPPIARATPAPASVAQTTMATPVPPSAKSHSESMVTMPPAVTPAGIKTDTALASTPPPKPHVGRPIGLWIGAAGLLVVLATLVTWRVASSPAASSSAGQAVSVAVTPPQTPTPATSAPPAATTMVQPPPAVETPIASATTAPEKTVKRTTPVAPPPQAAAKPSASAAPSAVPHAASTNPLTL